MQVEKKRHPAKYSDVLLPFMADMIASHWRFSYADIIDPFGGTGKIFSIEPLLAKAGLVSPAISAVELEPEWAAHDSRVKVGDALSLPWEDGYFQIAITSPAYGNRMADSHNAKDGSRRNTYKHAIERDLHPNNSGQLQWGPDYRIFHVKAWRELSRVLCPGALFLLNISNHIRGGKEMKVSEWHDEVIQGLGFTRLQWEKVQTRRNRQGANGNARVKYENLILYKKDL